MSKHRRFALCSALLLSLLCLSSGAALAQTVRVLLPEEPVTVLPGPAGGVCFEGEDLQFPGRTGQPNLPYRVLKILLPPEADLETVSVSLDNVVETFVGGLWDVEPVPPMATWDGEKIVEIWPEDRIFEEGKDVAVYVSDTLFPVSRTLEARTGELRELKVVDVPVALFRYNPVTRRLVRFENAEVVVGYESLPGRSVTGVSTGVTVPERLRKVLVNYDEVAPAYEGPSGAKSDPGGDPLPSYVIVTTGAILEASDSVDDFVRCKEAEGFDVEVVTEDEWGGGTGDGAAENIRSWLAGNYLALDAEYVLLVGNPDPESGDVPMKMLWPRNNATFSVNYAESPSDLYYADLTGNWDLDGDGFYGEWGSVTDDAPGDFGHGGIDTNWDVVVGRIPVYDSVDDLDAILSKTIRYETANSATTGWRRNALLPMKPSDPSTPGYQLGEEIKDDVLVPLGYDGYSRIYDENYDLEPAPDFTPCNADNVTTAWTDEAFGLVAWWTHGSQHVAADIMDPEHLTVLDDERPSVVFQCSCLNARPETADNLSYSLLKNGAVVTIGATRVSWYWRGQIEYAGTSTNSGMTSGFAGNLLLHAMDAGTALASLKQEAYATSDCHWMNFTDFNIYGDPSLNLEPGGASTGSVSVSIEGPEEARWLVNRNDSYGSGETVNFVSGVTYEISFSDVDGWVKPEAVTHTLSADVPLEIHAIYEERTLSGPTFVKSGGTGDGSSWDSPKDLAVALRDAMSGETILVAEGLYLPKYDRTNNPPLPGQEHKATFSLKSGVTVIGGFPDDLTGTISDDYDPSAYRTVLTGDLEGDDDTDVHGIVNDVWGLNGGNANHVVSARNASDLVVEGVIVTAGHADAHEDTSAAGFLAEHATFRLVDCRFIGNSATNAGGLGLLSSEAELEGCLFSANRASNDGAAVYVRYATASLKACRFAGNISGESGGGLASYYSETALEDCAFLDNETSGYGGAVLYYGDPVAGDSARVRRCTFDGNVSGYRGGALDLDQEAPVVENCTFSGNRAGSGAALHSRCDSLEVTNCTFSGNDDGGDGETLKTFWGRTRLRNCVFWDETTREIKFYDPDATPVVSHCVIRGGTEGILAADPISEDHVISDDPRLGPLADNGGFTCTSVLLPGSSALDAGTPVDTVSVDQRGVSRPRCGGFDIGACEDRPGAVTVFVEGPDEARWSLDGEGAYPSGATVEELGVGTHLVAFSPVDHWSLPALTEVSVYEGVTAGYNTEYGLGVAEPGSWSDVEPGDGVTLTWDAFDFLEESVNYEVYMLVDGVYVPVPADQVDGTSVTLDLNGHTTYTIRVDADGFEGQPWSFTTANRVPCLQRRSPCDGSDRLPVDTSLSWLYIDPDGDSVSYDLYLSGGTPLSPASLTRVWSGDATNYSPEALSCDHGYRWYVVATDSFGGTSSGDVWSFAVTPDAHRITPPLSADLLLDCGVNDLWVAGVDSDDLEAIGEILGQAIVAVGDVRSLDVTPLSGDVTLEELEDAGSALVAVLPGGFHLDVTGSGDANLLAVPVSLSFTEEEVGRTLSEETLLDNVHLFVLVGGQVYDLVALAGQERDTLFAVTSDVDDRGVTYFVDFRLYLAADSGLSSSAVADGAHLFTDTEDPGFIVDRASTGAGSFDAIVAEGTVSSASGGGGCSAFGSGPGAALLLAGVLLVIRRK